MQNSKCPVVLHMQLPLRFHSENVQSSSGHYNVTNNMTGVLMNSIACNLTAG